MSALAIEIVSDAICPWCWIGKRRLDRALAILPPGLDVTVTWRPFELNPGTPPSGIDRQAYRIAKFGSLEQSQAMDARVAAAGRPDGLSFRHDLMQRTPNTIDAHRLIWLSGEAGRQHELVEALFAAYFQHGRDIGDPAVLADTAEEAGLERGQAEAMLASDLGRAEVEAGLARSRGLGISGVPTVLATGRPVFSGAIAPEDMAARLLRAAG